MIRPERSEADRLAVLAELTHGVASSPTPAELERGLQALRTRLEPRARRPLRRVAALSAVAACALAIVALVLKWPSAATDVPVAVQRIEGGKMLEGGYLAEHGHTGVDVFFSEGSRFTLSPGTRGRVRSVTSAGARFALDHGSAAFQITPNQRGQWWVEAGPFVISVRGTDFSVAWEPTSERFEVQLRKGRVAVSGPVVGDELVLRPGQNLAVNLPKGETVISEARPRAPGPPAALSASSAAASASTQAQSTSGAKPSTATGTTTGASPSSVPSAARERRFREALANGQWDRILAEVEREGIDANLRTLTSDDLFALADAARYRKRSDLARAALLAHRARFPNSQRSLDALFLLGRTEELGYGRRAAIEHYDEYLSRAPAGTYAAEALGRKMILTKDVEGPESARRIAVEYLRRFPSGSYAEVARSLQQQR
jgi:TolA-binding protein